MPQTAAQLLAQSGFMGPGLTAIVDGNNNIVSGGPTATFAQPANTAGVVVGKNSPGTLWSATVTTTGTAGLDIYDNATTNSGTKLLSIPANAVVGTIYNFTNGSPAANGIVSNGVANCPAVTISYS
jgi:hypothetical protein